HSALSCQDRRSKRKPVQKRHFPAIFHFSRIPPPLQATNDRPLPVAFARRVRSPHVSSPHVSSPHVSKGSALYLYDVICVFEYCFFLVGGNAKAAEGRPQR